MNWQAVTALVTGVLAGAALANYLMLLSIKNAILEQTAQLKDWARGEFATAKETERRLEALERRGAHLKGMG